MVEKVKPREIEQALALESDDLNDLLSQARKLILEQGVKATSQRGSTWSLNNVVLTWADAGEGRGRYGFWSERDDEWYQNSFVRKEGVRPPEALAAAGDIVFPYTYAHRARFYDGGWGYGLAVVRAAKELDYKPGTALKDFDSFKSWLGEMGELVHLQTVMVVLSWWGGTQLSFWIQCEGHLQKMVNRGRVDVLERIAHEVRQTPNTRRAVTPSLMYSLDYRLSPMMGVPPYQNFQILPGSSDEPISSSHWHRSLDASGGAQLDFNHDRSWQDFVSSQTGRPAGSITIYAGNLHLYAASQEEAETQIRANKDIEEWLMFVTDGYRSGNGRPRELLAQESYLQNAQRVYSEIK